MKFVKPKMDTKNRSLIKALTATLSIIIINLGIYLLTAKLAEETFNINSTQILIAHRDALARPLWTFANSNVTKLGEEIVKNNQVAGVTVRNEKGNIVFSTGSEAIGQSKLHKIQINYEDNEVGELELLFSTKPLQRKIINTFTLIVVTEIIILLLAFWIWRFNSEIQNRKKIESELLNTNDRLRINEEKFRQLVKLCPGGIYQTDTNGNCIYANDKWLEMAGLSFNEAKGQGWLKGIHPDDREGVSQAWYDMVKSNGNWVHEYRFLNRSGKSIWVLGLATSFKNQNYEITGYLGINIDVTDQKRASLELSESELKYRTLFENMPEGVFYQKADGTIIDFNKNALKMFGLTSEQFLGRTSFHPEWRVIHEDGSDCPGEEHPSMVALKTGKPVLNAVAGVYNPTKQHFVWLDINAIPQFHKNETRPHQVFVTMRDITEIKQKENELIQTNLKISRQKELLDTIDSLQTLFIGEQSDQELFDTMLIHILELTDSQYGFVDSLELDCDGKSCLEALAISNIAWDDESRAYYEKMAPGGLRFFDFDALFGPAVKNGEVIISNFKPDDPRRKGTPAGHPSIDTFLAMPLKHEGNIIGVIAIANSPEGYGEKLVRELDPIWVTCAQLVNAYKIKKEKTKIDNELKEYSKTQTTLIREINHRVKNNLALIIGLIHGEIDSLKASEKDAKRIMERMLLKIEGLDMAHRMLSESYWKPIPISTLCTGILENLQTTLKKTDLTFEVTQSEITISSSQAHHLAIIINELVTNSAKHALPDNRKLEISITTYVEDSFIVIEFKDNGQGFPHKVLEEGGNSMTHGLGLVKGILEHSLGGRLILKNDDGAVTLIKIKKTSSV